MAKNPALDKILSRMERVDVAATGETEDELKAARESSEAGDDEGAAPEPTPAETPVEPEKPPEPTPAETPPAGTETPPEAPAAAKPDEDATREENARRAAQRRDRESREAKAELARQRAENERLLRELNEIRNRQPTVATAGAPATQPPADLEPPKPGAEPDPEQYPVEHDRWEAKLARHDAWDARQQTRQLQEQINSWSQGAQRQSEEQRVISQFDGLMATHERAYQEENPEYDNAIKFLEQKLTARMRHNFVPEHEISERIRWEKRQFLITNTAQGRNNGEANPGDYALGRLYDLAIVEGFQPDVAPAVNGKTPTTRTQQTPAARIADSEKRQAAARSASTMSATTVAPASDEKMSAERWMEMNAKQRNAWKKAHPDFNATDMLDDGGEDFGNPILETQKTMRSR